jgi:hypothetical protein
MSGPRTARLWVGAERHIPVFTGGEQVDAELTISEVEYPIQATEGHMPSEARALPVHSPRSCWMTTGLLSDEPQSGRRQAEIRDPRLNQTRRPWPEYTMGRRGGEMAVLVRGLEGAAPMRRMSVMKRILIATLLAASTLSFAGAAMAADNGNTQNLDQVTRTQISGTSAGSFVARQSLQYNTDNGQ